MSRMWYYSHLQLIRMVDWARLPNASCLVRLRNRRRRNSLFAVLLPNEPMTMLFLMHPLLVYCRVLTKDGENKALICPLPQRIMPGSQVLGAATFWVLLSIGQLRHSSIAVCIIRQPIPNPPAFCHTPWQLAVSRVEFLLSVPASILLNTCHS